MSEGEPDIGRSFTTRPCAYVDIDPSEVFGVASNRAQLSDMIQLIEYKYKNVDGAR